MIRLRFKNPTEPVRPSGLRSDTIRPSSLVLVQSLQLPLHLTAGHRLMGAWSGHVRGRGGRWWWGFPSEIHPWGRCGRKAVWETVWAGRVWHWCVYKRSRGQLGVLSWTCLTDWLYSSFPQPDSSYPRILRHSQTRSVGYCHCMRRRREAELRTNVYTTNLFYHIVSHCLNCLFVFRISTRTRSRLLFTEVQLHSFPPVQPLISIRWPLTGS